MPAQRSTEAKLPKQVNFAGILDVSFDNITIVKHDAIKIAEIYKDRRGVIRVSGDCLGFNLPMMHLLAMVALDYHRRFGGSFA